jgi:LysM repeat protein
MSRVAEMFCSRLFPRAAVLALIAAGVAACSADTSRFNDNPFASIIRPDASMQQAQTAQAPQPHSGPATAATPAGAGKAVASNSPRSGEATGSVLRKTSGNWSWEGGTAITVAAGDSVDTIARRYGVPTSAIMQANNIAAPATLHPGQRLVIPRYASTRIAAAPAPPHPRQPLQSMLLIPVFMSLRPATRSAKSRIAITGRSTRLPRPTTFSQRPPSMSATA